MADSLFTIATTPPASLKLEVGEDGTFSFTLTSLAAPDKSQELILQALLIGADGKGAEVEWLVPGPQRTLTLTGGETATITITAKPRTTTPLGENKIKLAVADKERPHDAYLYSSPVTCAVTGKPAVPLPTKPFPKWLIPVIIGGVLVLGGAAFAIWKFVIDKAPELPGLNQACNAADEKACRDNLVCSSENKCLLPAGGTCTENGVCDSGECVTRLGVCATRIGGTCDPATIAQVPCPTESHCDADTKICLKDVCKAGDLQCTADGRSVSTCQDNGTWKTELCPPQADFCRDGKCGCAADKDKPCNCGGKIQCDGTCSTKPCTSNCVNGVCCSQQAGAACGQCKGITKCDGTCSVPTPLNLGKPCGQCKGTFQCDGSCSPAGHPDVGKPCGECGGKVQCNGTCSVTTPRCPAGFDVDPVAPGQCRSKIDVQIHRALLPIPGVCGFKKDQTVKVACGTNRVQSKVQVKIVAGKGGCGAKFASTNLNDCSVEAHLLQPPPPSPLFPVCAPSSCEVLVRAFSRRPQCTK